MPRRSRAFGALLVGLALGWFVAEKGWHRHALYLGAMLLLVGLMWG